MPTSYGILRKLETFLMSIVHTGKMLLLSASNCTFKTSHFTRILIFATSGMLYCDENCCLEWTMGQIHRTNNAILDDIVEAHCYFVDIGRTDREQIRSRINNNDCRTFRPRRPLSTAYRTNLSHTAVSLVLYAVDKGLRGRNVLQSLLLILLRICSRSVRLMQYLAKIYICILTHEWHVNWNNLE